LPESNDGGGSRPRCSAMGILRITAHRLAAPRARSILEKIVAENQIVGQAILKRKFECVDIVDALADEGALTEHVLINIGYGSRIGIDAGCIPKHPRIPRSVRAWKAHGHARLKDTVPLR